jgi:hypothetical protein
MRICLSKNNTCLRILGKIGSDEEASFKNILGRIKGDKK